MVRIRPIGSDDEHRTAVRIPGGDDMHGRPVAHAEKQRAWEWTIIRIILNEIAVEECRLYLGSGNPTFHHTLERMPLPFNTPGTNGLSQGNTIQIHLRGQSPGLVEESQWLIQERIMVGAA
jgi:hypothetical protein